MKYAIATLKSTAPYSQSKPHEAEGLEGEGKDDYARRTWREHLHVDADGNVFIPPTAFKNCISEAAKYMSISVPGKGKATYTKNFEAGIVVANPMPLGIKKDDVVNERLFLPADGRRGGPKRVWKYYPVFVQWAGDVEFIIVDETVLQSSMRDKTKTILEEVLIGAGRFIGIGRFRPRNNGYYGRFDVVKMVIKE